MSDHQTEVRDFRDLFVAELEGVYDMELKLVDALEEMSGAATNDNLSKGFAIHRTETETQVEHVEAAFDALGREPTRRDNRIVDGLLAERERFDAGVSDDAVLNTYYLTAAIATERFEITSYEGLLVTAEQANLGADVTEPLERNLEQEAKTLRKLQALVEGTDGRTLWDRLPGSKRS
ncbi:hypothetical protein CV102_22975 [Natronococcus pandeyae]|uniref:DUF892 family protein n=1 Tax=Natronococcus pandeyae TaxID=2055836 RepID=A0A8J8TPY0_9EURY|nr:DUF892 family protein [Natronococcus pandeyae]TYL36325.1 hypothetical protein CV102_22975 [Natronococcus pandeyae]